MAILQGNQGQTGKQVGQNLTGGFGEFSDVLVTELMARFYQQNYRGALYSWGKTSTALSANSISLNSTTTPIIGLWNPSSNTVNAVILQVRLQSVLQAASSTTQGALVYAVSTGNAGITTGNAPWNRKTLVQSGSSC